MPSKSAPAGPALNFTAVQEAALAYAQAVRARRRPAARVVHTHEEYLAFAEAAQKRHEQTQIAKQELLNAALALLPDEETWDDKS
jgi:hypothetical protein